MLSNRKSTTAKHHARHLDCGQGGHYATRQGFGKVDRIDMTAVALATDWLVCTVAKMEMLPLKHWSKRSNAVQIMCELSANLLTSYTTFV